MTKAELLAQLANQVEEILDPEWTGQGSGWIEQQPGGVNYYKALCLVPDGQDGVKQDKIGYFVRFEGVTAGLQVDANGDPIFEQVPVLDANGDPVLDVDGEPTFTDGDQVDIPESAAERAYMEKTVKLPKDKNDKGLAYLGSKMVDGTIYTFKLEGEPNANLGAASFFIVTAWLVNKDGSGVPDGTTTEARWLVQEDFSGNPFHSVIA